MTTCPSDVQDQFRCPSKWDLWGQVMRLLPRGRAWQTHEDVYETHGGAVSSQVGTFQASVTPLGADTGVERLTILGRYWAACAEVVEPLHQRACRLIEEFFCATTDELLAEWHVDYGYPDPCEPYDTLCAKVAALGGQTCAYIASVAAARGWAVACMDCGALTAECMMADCDQLCECRNGVIEVVIDLDDSPAYADDGWISMHADMMQADCHEACPPIPGQLHHRLTDNARAGRLAVTRVGAGQKGISRWPTFSGPTAPASIR